jgi:hypothetical protein
MLRISDAYGPYFLLKPLHYSTRSQYSARCWATNSGRTRAVMSFDCYQSNDVFFPMAGTAQKTPGSTTPGWEPAAEAATDTAISAWSTPAAAIAAAGQYCHRLLGGAFFLPSALSDACVCCNIHSVQVLVPNQIFFQKKNTRSRCLSMIRLER